MTNTMTFTTPLSNFIGFSDPDGICQLQNCVINPRYEGLCADPNLNNGRVMKTISASIIGSDAVLTFDTTLASSIQYDCFRCMTNEVTPARVTSYVFYVDINPYDCYSTFTLSPIPSTIIINPQVTPLTNLMQLVTSYFSTTASPNCLPLSYSLEQAGKKYSTPSLSFEADGSLMIDSNTLFYGSSLQIKLQLHNAEQLLTNLFEVKVECSDQFNYIVTQNPLQPESIEVGSDKTKTYLAFDLLPIVVQQPVCKVSAISIFEAKSTASKSPPDCFSQGSIATDG